MAYMNTMGFGIPPISNIGLTSGIGSPGPIQSWFTQFLGLSSLFGLGSTILSAAGGGEGATNPFAATTARLFVLGVLIEMGRRFMQWLMQRLNFQFCITAQFDHGDPAYEWILLFLTQEKIWKRTRDFKVTAHNSRRKWGIKPGADAGVDIEDNADYVPTYEMPQIFRWRGYWVEVRRDKGFVSTGPGMPAGGGGSIYLSIYSLNMAVLSALVEDARQRYIEVSRPHVTIHMADSVGGSSASRMLATLSNRRHRIPNYGPVGFTWSNVKHKAKRPLESIILPEGCMDELLSDARDFLDTEDWYVNAGIPHRRGYLLYGPPGTGKTSTIYALAGELSLEIYSLSLASTFVDDIFLLKAVSSMPKHSILLIEDIDCAFPSREEEEARDMIVYPGMPHSPPYVPPRSAVTLSGLLNIIDGVGSEDGKIFFATTNYIDRLDPALMRPGRIDKKIEYSLATPGQATALFARFFPHELFPDVKLAPGAKLDLPIELENGELKPSKVKDIVAGSNNASSPSASTTTTTKAEVPSSSESEKTALLPTTPSPSSDLMASLATLFGRQIPPNEFSTAELQGFLLSCKKYPASAVNTIANWIAQERKEREDKKEREEKRKLKVKEQQEKYAKMYRDSGGFPGPYGGGPFVPGLGLPSPKRTKGKKGDDDDDEGDDDSDTEKETAKDSEQGREDSRTPGKRDSNPWVKVKANGDTDSTSVSPEPVPIAVEDTASE